MKFFTSVFTAIALFFTSLPGLFSGISTYKYEIDTEEQGMEIPNIVDNINV